ncbi:MAG: hypothetical protein ACOX6P_08925 [Candidatus Merdivicinus sp.]|jgi:hypothetical protein
MHWTDWAQILLTILLAVFCLAPLTANYPRLHRDRQVLLPIAALFYGWISISFMDGFAKLIVWIFEMLEKWFPSVRQFPLALCLSYFSCMLIFLLYPLYKLIVRGFSGWLTRRFPALYRVTAGKFYQHHDGYNAAFLRPSFQQLHGFCRALLIGLILSECLLFGLSVRYPGMTGFPYPVYPMPAILLLAEMVNFLGGYCLQEYEEEILGTDGSAIEETNWKCLHDIYRKLLPERHLCGNSVENSGQDHSVQLLLSALMREEDPQIQAAAQYFQNLVRNGYSLEENRIHSALDLLAGKSVLYATPFYRDLTPYLMLVFYRTMVRGGKVLLLTGCSEEIHPLISWMKEDLTAITGVPGLWRVGVFGEENLDAAVLPASMFYQQQILPEQKNFLRETSFVFLAEPSQFAGWGQVGLRILLSQCRPDVHYAACDRNYDGLVDTLSHLLHVNLTEVISTDPPARNTDTIFWKADGDAAFSASPRILPHIARYLGMGTDLAAIAFRNQIARLCWVGSKRVPLSDLNWLAGQYYQPICEYAAIPVSQQSLQDHFLFTPTLWSETRQPQNFFIVEDEFDNLFEISRQFATRAEERIFLHVMTGQYLLRDYMCANQPMLETDPKAFPAIAPDNAITPRNTAVHLLLLLAEAPQREETVRQILHAGGISGENTFETFTVLLNRFFPLDAYPHAIQTEIRRELSPDGTAMLEIRWFSIGEPVFSDEVIRQLQNARYISEKYDGQTELLDARPLCLVYQAYLPGQYHVFAGKYYEVRSINRERGVLLQRAADHFSARRSYRQLRKYTLSNLQPQPHAEGSRQISGIQISVLTADVTVQTDGYLELSRYDDLKTARPVLLDSIPPREYRQKTILELTFPNIQSNQRFTIALLLRELFRTAFPDSHEYLAAVTSTKEWESLPRGLMDGLSGGKDGAIYLIEDSQIDLGLSVAAERNLLRFLEQMTEFLLWHRQMLEAAAESDSEAAAYAANHYLLYGGESVPDGISPNETCDYLIQLGFDRNSIHWTRTAPTADDSFADSGLRCDFCGMPLSDAGYEVLQDGRKRCSACRRTAIDTLEDFQTLYQETRSTMESFFEIEIRSEIRVQLADASEMAKIRNDTSDSPDRAVGMAIRNSDGYTLMIENGAPRMDAAATIVHELTHIWQYQNWDEKSLHEVFPSLSGKALSEAETEQREGMAAWAEVQYLLLIGENHRAASMETSYSVDKGIYGRGFRAYQAAFPLGRDGICPTRTPFQPGNSPLLPEADSDGEDRKEISDASV